MKQIKIALMAPRFCGKSTVAKIIAKDLGYTYLDDTGLLCTSGDLPSFAK